MQSLLEEVRPRSRSVMSSATGSGRGRTVGIAWYRREDYPEIRRVMADAEVLPEDYDAWLRLAQQVATIEEAKGSAIVRALISPEAFADWCLATQRRADVDARTRHVNAA